MVVTGCRLGSGALMSVLASSSRAITYDPPCEQGLVGMGRLLDHPVGEALVLVFDIITYFGDVLRRVLVLIFIIIIYFVGV